MEPKEVHVICNTHWDREWVYPSAETRLLLIEFMDHLLDLLDRDPRYHSYLMDSQTLCLEDYLEHRPQALERIKKHVTEGRLVVGPWYSLPEEYCVNGESLLRNLIVGHQVAQSLGRVMKIGYTPFSYGQTSQMPQIYQGFDIDTIIFYRGINTPKSEFVMEGPDGSRLLGCRFGALSRFSFYFYIYRVVVHDMTRDEWWYTWQKGALPFRLCNEFHPRAHYYVVDPAAKHYHKDRIPEQMRKLIADESEHFTTKYIASMQGFDSSEPDPIEPGLIADAQAAAPEHKVFQSSIEDFMNKLKTAVKDPYVIHGESRDPGATGKWTHLFGDVISSRTRTKRMNTIAENALQRWAEPFALCSWALGDEYPKRVIDRTWRYLLKNHPHDTICGAGVDQMEKDMVYRYDQVNILAEGIMRRGFQGIQKRIDNSELAPQDTVLTVFNPCPYPRSEVVTAYVDLPDGCEIDAFTLRDAHGRIAPKQEVSRFPWGTLVRNLTDVSLELRAQRVLLHFEAERIPALGYKTYVLRREEFETGSQESLVTAHNAMENAYLAVAINDNGTLRITHKQSGQTFDGLHYLEDSGETGHSWVHMTPEFNEVITSHGCPVHIELEESGRLLARYRVDYRMLVPDGLEQRDDGVRRATARKEMLVTSRITLRRGAQAVEVKTSFDNPCKFHRLRVCFPTLLGEAQVSAAEAAFDVIERGIERGPDSAYYNRENPTYPNHRFVDVSDGAVGLALVNDGIREYEVTDTPERLLALTLLRAYEFRQSPVIDRWEVHPEMPLSQALGEHEFRYAIYPHAGAWDGSSVFQQADVLNLPLEIGQAGPHQGDLPREMSFLSIGPDELVLTALKRGEERETMILRFFNPTARDLEGKVSLFKEIKGAWLTNMNEERREELTPSGKSVAVPVPKKKIITVEIEL
jgi:alpha-mannosidase